MADSTVPPTPLSARFEEWFKSQPEAQAQAQAQARAPYHKHNSHDNHHLQQPTRTYHSKGANDLITPIRYDFESKYAIEDADPFADGEDSELSQSSSVPASEVVGAQHLGLDGMNGKARQMLGIDEPRSVTSKAFTGVSQSDDLSSSIPSQHPLPRSTSLAPKNVPASQGKNWVQNHLKILIALSIIFQFGIIALTIAIVLCTHDVKTGHIRDGSIITGVIGCASILCCLFAGYDMLVAEYSASRHNLGNDMEKGVEKGDMKGKIKDWGREIRVLRNFDEKEMQSSTEESTRFTNNNIPRSKHHIQAMHLPHNIIYNSRLSNPFSPGIPLSEKGYESPDSPRAPPGEVYKRIREARRLTPNSPLPSYLHPPQSSSLQSSGEDSSPGAKITSLDRYIIPETWAQRLESRIRPTSEAKERLTDLAEGEEPNTGNRIRILDGYGGVEGNGTTRDGSDSDATSRIISLYSALGPHDQLYHDVLRSLPVSPLSPRLYPRSSVTASDAASFIHFHNRESAQRVRIWQKYLLGPGVELSAPSPLQPEPKPQPQSQLERWLAMNWGGKKNVENRRSDAAKRMTRDRAWSRAFTALASQPEEGERYLSWG